jgi:hypothetical protein
MLVVPANAAVLTKQQTTELRQQELCTHQLCTGSRDQLFQLYSKNLLAPNDPRRALILANEQGQQQGKAETDASFGGDIFGGDSGGSGAGSGDSNSPHGAGNVCTPLLTIARFLLTHSCSLIQLCR